MTVEIDESLIFKRKYHRGRKMSSQQWVVGGICRETKEIFILPCDYRDRTTLFHIISQNVQTGSHILTDGWKAYIGLEELGYTHDTVNHSDNFVNPETGACTNQIENVWKWLKYGLPPTGTKKHNLLGYIYRFMWNKKYGNNRFKNIVAHIASHHGGLPTSSSNSVN